MPDAALLLACWLASYLGFALLALSQPRHWRSAGGAAGPTGARAVAYRIAACAALIASFAAAVLRDGAGFGAVLWVTSLSLGGVCLVATLSQRARSLRALTRGSW